MGIIHIITPEYSPTPGGVADYARHVAHALSGAGEEVHVWCPAGADRPSGGGVHVHGVFEGFNEDDLARAAEAIDRLPAPHRLFVQWVPHAYGHRAMNLRFCLWLRHRARIGDCVELMVHEPFVTFLEGTWRQTMVAAVHRVMTMVLLQAASRVWISIPAWEAMWKPFALGRAVQFSWLPVPSGFERPAEQDIQMLRARVFPACRFVVGHLGTYGPHVTAMLDAIFPDVLRSTADAGVLLLGAGSSEYRDAFARRHPALEHRIFASGTLDEAALALHAAACDVLVQPYPDGISSRRTSAMAALRLGVPLISTRGHLTEPFWAESGAVRFCEVDRLAEMAAHVLCLSSDREARGAMASAGRDLYARMFDIGLTVRALTRQAEKAA